MAGQPHREQYARPGPGRQRDGELLDPGEAVPLVHAYQRAVLARPAVDADQADAAIGGLLPRPPDQRGAVPLRYSSISSRSATRTRVRPNGSIHAPRNL